MNEEQFGKRLRGALGEPPPSDLRRRLEAKLTVGRSRHASLSLAPLAATLALLIVAGFVGWRLVYQRATSPATVKGSPVTSAVPTATAVDSSAPTASSGVGTAPSPRSGSSIAYDTARGRIVLFGGQGDPAYLNDTWTWDGATWSQRHPATSPPGRSGAAMAYDGATKTIVLFGGWGQFSEFNIGQLNDTWIWNGVTWVEQHPRVSPSARAHAVVAYDGATGTVVLFGGEEQVGRAKRRLGDTWIWDGSIWSQRTPAVSPPARSGASMACVAAQQKLLLFGGATGGGALSDTWTWDGVAWMEQRSAIYPPARYEASLAYDIRNQAAVLFGGYGASVSLLGDTWTWNGFGWTEKHPQASPQRRALANMAYDDNRKKIMLFGGVSAGTKESSPAINDTWTWDGTTWVQAGHT